MRVCIRLTRACTLGRALQVEAGGRVYTDHLGPQELAAASPGLVRELEDLLGTLDCP